MAVKKRTKRQRLEEIAADLANVDMMPGTMRYYWVDSVRRCVIRVTGLHRDGKHLLASFHKGAGKWSKPRKFLIADTKEITGNGHIGDAFRSDQIPPSSGEPIGSEERCEYCGAPSRFGCGAEAVLAGAR